MTAAHEANGSNVARVKRTRRSSSGRPLILCSSVIATDGRSRRNDAVKQQQKVCVCLAVLSVCRYLPPRPAPACAYLHPCMTARDASSRYNQRQPPRLSRRLFSIFIFILVFVFVSSSSLPFACQPPTSAVPSLPLACPLKNSVGPDPLVTRPSSQFDATTLAAGRPLLRRRRQTNDAQHTPAYKIHTAHGTQNTDYAHAQRQTAKNRPPGC